MGNKSGIKWNGVTQAQTQNTIETIGSDVQIILRDPRTEQEWVTSSTDYINALVSLGVIPSSAGSWLTKGNKGTDYTNDFIGTEDDEPLTFRTNNVARLGFDENGGALSTTDVLNPSGSYSILQWSTDAINQKIYVSDVLVTGVKVTTGDVTILTEDVGTGVYNETIVSLAEILLSASGTGISDIHVYPNGEIGIASTANTTINAITATGGVSGNVGIGTTTPTELFYVDGTVGTTASIFKVQKNSLFDDVGFRYTGNTAAEDSLVDFLVGGLYGLNFSHTLNDDYSFFVARSNVENQWRSNGDITLQNTSGDGNVGIGTASPASKLTVDTGDVEVVGDANGLILESPDATRYRVTVANGGTLTVTAV